MSKLRRKVMVEEELTLHEELVSSLSFKIDWAFEIISSFSILYAELHLKKYPVCSKCYIVLVS